MIIKKRQFPEEKTYSIEFAGRNTRSSVGKLAELCNASVLTRYGDTVVLVTATASAKPRDGIGLFPAERGF